ncbi:unnamed protein product [Chrysoparadoxa australica]
MGMEVGQVCRAKANQRESCRATVSCINREDGCTTYDLMWEGDLEPQEMTVPEEAVQALEPFEATLPEQLDMLMSLARETDADSKAKLVQEANAAKALGNKLFGLRDYRAAAGVYDSVLLALERDPSRSIGTQLLVRPADASSQLVSAVRPGMISSSDGAESYEVIYDEADADGVDEEAGVHVDRLVGLSDAPCLQCSLQLNRARCALKLGLNEEAVRHCTAVAALIKHYLAGEEGKQRVCIADRRVLRDRGFAAFSLRGAAHLEQKHIKLAARDARNMEAMANDAAQRARAVKFIGEVTAAGKKLTRQNKALAKEVAAWVEHSMSVSEDCAAEGLQEGQEVMIEGSDGLEREGEAQDGGDVAAEAEQSSCLLQ